MQSHLYRDRKHTMHSVITLHAAGEGGWTKSNHIEISRSHIFKTPSCLFMALFCRTDRRGEGRNVKFIATAANIARMHSWGKRTSQVQFSTSLKEMCENYKPGHNPDLWNIINFSYWSSVNSYKKKRTDQSNQFKTFTQFTIFIQDVAIASHPFQLRIRQIHGSMAISWESQNGTTKTQRQHNIKY